MVIVLSISITILVLRFGSSVLEDNFVAQLSTHYQNSVEFMAFYGLLNFYLYTMAFVYSPSKNAVFGELLADALLAFYHAVLFQNPISKTTLHCPC
jgi:hypothetical protein